MIFTTLHMNLTTLAMYPAKGRQIQKGCANDWVLVSCSVLKHAARDSGISVIYATKSVFVLAEKSVSIMYATQLRVFQISTRCMSLSYKDFYADFV